MSTNALDVRLRNLLLILLLLVVIIFCGYQEGYVSCGGKEVGTVLENAQLLLLAVGIGFFGVAIWLGWAISTMRLASLMLVVLILEYIKETLGIRVGLWKYMGDGYLTGVLAWVLMALVIYAGSWRAVLKLAMKSKITLPRFLNPILILMVFTIIPWMMPNPLPEGAPMPSCTWDAGFVGNQLCGFMAYLFSWTNLYWIFYGTLMLICVLASLWTDTRALVAVYISVLILAFIGETAGGLAEIWQYLVGGEVSSFPPFYLMFGCLPLEMLAAFAISAVIAGEPVVPPPPGGPPDNGPGEETEARDMPSSETPNENAPADEPPNSRSSGSKASADGGPGNSLNEPPPEPPPNGESEPPLTEGERVFRVFMLLSAIAYLVVGTLFALVPHWILGTINWMGSLMGFSGSDIPVYGHRFWVSMTFSMMMCISVLAFYVQYNVRKNKNYTAPLLAAKAASSLSALFFFIVLTNKFFAYLVIFAVDGFLFWLTLYFYIRANMAYLKVQTAYFRQEIANAKKTGPTTVAVYKGDNKFELLDKVLDTTEFFKVLNRRLDEVGKEKKDFSVVIKPNFMFMHAKEDYSTYTDPKLVEHLIDKIREKGFTNLAVVEAQSTLGNYYAGRDVVNVAKNIGHEPNGKYRIVDLTEEKVPHYYGGRLGWHWIGPTWRDADFRISFAKNKTHFFCSYTLALKNIYGTLPIQNKYRWYHVKREYDWPTIESMEDRNCPVHFALVDAFYSADGQFGVCVDPNPNPTRTIFGGENLIAVDWVGAKKMGLDPDDVRIGRFYYLAVKALGRPEINWVGDKSVYEPWENVSQIFIQALDIVEEAYHAGNWSFAIVSANSPDFPLTVKSSSVLFLRWLIKPFKAVYYKHDAL